MSTSGHGSDGNWAEVRAALEKQFQGRGPSLPLRDAAAAGSRAAVEAFTNATGVTLPQTPAGDHGRADVRAATGGPIVRAFWWGFHVEVSSQGLRDFISVADPVIQLIQKIGPVAGPAAPWIALVASFVAGALRLLGELDRGQGVYVSMSWFAPGIFVPTSV